MNRERSEIENPSEFYDFEAALINGNIIRMSEFSEKVILVVNTASKCGYARQFETLESLYNKYKNNNFIILGFPCSQFGNQEFTTSDEISTFCEINYGVTFPIFSKVNVNGSNAHPIFSYLRSKLPGLLYDGIKWNFTKFLIDKNGVPRERFAPHTNPQAIEKYIVKLLQ